MVAKPSGNNHIVFYPIEPSPDPEKEAVPSSDLSSQSKTDGAALKSAEPSVPHTHSWTFGTIYTPSEDLDGLEGEYCSCGAFRNTSVIPAIDALIRNRYQQIEQAYPGKDTILEMKNNCNFSQAFMKKIASKNDCSFILRFTYEKKHYEAYIPAGTTFDTGFEWYGPEKIMEMFKWKQLN